VDDPLLTDDARALVADLRVRKQSVATAESLTAGLLAATLAGVPGASEVLRGGLVTYTERTKVLLAGVAPQILDELGPVAGPTARALAVGARQRCEAHLGCRVDRCRRPRTTRRAQGRHGIHGSGRAR
jgi:nicotinamide-nucleotide amidase